MVAQPSKRFRRLPAKRVRAFECVQWVTKSVLVDKFVEKIIEIDCEGVSEAVQVTRKAKGPLEVCADQVFVD